jgi:6-pyruvoyltetrahydropterin/6-carboxytetrahydropterin synthase
MYELSKQFRFDAAHSLERVVDTEPSRRIHGHSYRAEVTLRGMPEAKSGMIVDFGLFERALEEARQGLDHRLLDEVPGLSPATMENIAAWIWNQLSSKLPQISKVTIYRDSYGESCVYYGPSAQNKAAAE